MLARNEILLFSYIGMRQANKESHVELNQIRKVYSISEYRDLQNASLYILAS
jgi:hypothetical protein